MKEKKIEKNCPYCGREFEFEYGATFVSDDFDDNCYIITWSTTCEYCQHTMNFTEVYRLEKRKFEK